MSDGPELERAKSGDKRAFEVLVRRHHGALRTFLRRLSGDQADDLAQETFVIAWMQLTRFRDGSNFRSWLFGIAYRKYLTHSRGDRRRITRQTRGLSTEGFLADIDREIVLTDFYRA